MLQFLLSFLRSLFFNLFPVSLCLLAKKSFFSLSLVCFPLQILNVVYALSLLLFFNWAFTFFFSVFSYAVNVICNFFEVFIPKFFVIILLILL